MQKLKTEKIGLKFETAGDLERTWIQKLCQNKSTKGKCSLNFCEVYLAY